MGQSDKNDTKPFRACAMSVINGVIMNLMVMGCWYKTSIIIQISNVIFNVDYNYNLHFLLTLS